MYKFLGRSLAIASQYKDPDTWVDTAGGLTFKVVGFNGNCSTAGSQPSQYCNSPLPTMHVCADEQEKGFALFNDFDFALKKQITRDWTQATTNDYVIANDDEAWKEGWMCTTDHPCYNHPYYYDAGTKSVQAWTPKYEIALDHPGNCLFQQIYGDFPWPTNGVVPSKYTVKSTNSTTVHDCQNDCINESTCNIWTLLFDHSQTMSTDTCFLQTGQAMLAASTQEYKTIYPCMLPQDDPNFLYVSCTGPGGRNLCAMHSGVSVSGWKFCETATTPTQGWIDTNLCKPDSAPRTRVIANYAGDFGGHYTNTQPDKACGKEVSGDGEVCLNATNSGLSMMNQLDILDISRDWEAANQNDWVYSEALEWDWNVTMMSYCTDSASQGCYNHPSTVSRRLDYQILPSQDTSNKIQGRGDCLFQMMIGDYPWTLGFKYTIASHTVLWQQQCQQLCYRTDGCEIWTFSETHVTPWQPANCFLQSQGALDALNKPVSDDTCGFTDSHIDFTNQKSTRVQCDNSAADNSAEKVDLCAVYSSEIISGLRLCDPSKTPTVLWMQENIDICKNATTTTTTPMTMTTTTTTSSSQ